jgi:hypothetical protein
VLTIEAPPPPEPEDDQLGALYDLADAEKDAARSNRVDDTPRCPQCASEMAPDAVLCVNCGYDLRSKSKVTTKKAPALSPLESLGGEKKSPLNYAKGGKDKPEREARGEGSFVLGLVFGVVFATGGGIVYALARYYLDDVPFIGYVTYWMVLGVGYLAGMGVDKGYKGGNAFAGLTAAGITLVVTVVMKFVVLAAILAPTVKKAMDQAASERDNETVVQMVRDEEMTKAGLSPHAASDEEQEKYELIASKRVQTMPQKEYDALEKKADAYEEREMLYEHVYQDVLKEQKIDEAKITRPQEIVAVKTAESRIAGLSDSEVSKRLKAADAQAEAELRAKLAEASKKSSGSSDKAGKSDSGINGSVVGFGIILLVLFGIWYFLPVLIAMLLAYKVAANA